MWDRIPNRRKSEYKETAEAFYRSDEWREIRYRAFKYYGNKCACCGRGPEDGVILNVDHIIPLSMNWSTRLDINNLQILCQTCNLGKTNVDSVNWRDGSYVPICKSVPLISPIPVLKKGKSKFISSDDSFIKSWVNNFWLCLKDTRAITKEQAVDLVKYVLQQYKRK